MLRLNVPVNNFSVMPLLLPGDSGGSSYEQRIAFCTVHVYTKTAAQSNKLILHVLTLFEHNQIPMCKLCMLVI